MSREFRDRRNIVDNINGLHAVILMVVGANGIAVIIQVDIFESEHTDLQLCVVQELVDVMGSA